MGWTCYHAANYKNSGKNFTIDKKAEIESIFDKRYEVIKGVIVGSVYYGALRDTETGSVSASVVLTHTDMKDFFNFGYKAMSEDCGPCECDCPASVLDLLTETDSEWAIEWRQRCRANIEKKKSPHALKNLPVGAVIRFVLNGQSYEIEKMAPRYQFKRAWWYVPATNTYIPAGHIPNNYEVVTV